MGKSKIEWTEKVWNPVRGCARVSEGCRNCYAERMAVRFAGAGQPYEGLAVMKSDGPHWTGEVRCVEEALALPLKWRNPARIFVNSMSDLFHEAVPDEFIDKVFAVMAHCSAEWMRCMARDCDHCPCDENKLHPMSPHTFQILTKRPERALHYLSDPERRASIIEAWDKFGWYFEDGAPISRSVWPLPNVWLGVSVENQKTADERIPLLLQTPAAVRWISAEPLLGPIEITPFVTRLKRTFQTPIGPARLTGGIALDIADVMLDWVVGGGESGPGARPMHPEWARTLRDQCKAAGVPFFFKQWGAWAPGGSDPKKIQCVDPTVGDDGIWMSRVGKKHAGDLLDWVQHHAYPAGAGGGAA